MARKTAALLKSAPVTISKRSATFIEHERKRVPMAGCEPEYARYIEALEKDAEADARLDAVHKLVEKEGGTSSAKHWDAFQSALRDSARAASVVFGALDVYLHRTRHINDAVLVPEAELRAIVIDSLSDKVEDLKFTTNYGMLGSKVTQYLRKHAQEMDAVEPPLCADCAF